MWTILISPFHLISYVTSSLLREMYLQNYFYLSFITVTSALYFSYQTLNKAAGALVLKIVRLLHSFHGAESLV